MDTWRPVSTAYGACSNTESANRPEGAVSAIGNDSSATAIIGKHPRISVIHSWFRARGGAHRRRGRCRWAWQCLDGGIDEDLALLLAVRSQHDGIDWDRFAGPAPLSEHGGIDGDRYAGLAPRSQHDGVDWDRFAGPGPRSQYDGIDWDCARDQGERVP